jgi:hypothetical protein
MPDRQVERLRGFLQQGGGRLSKRAREQELAALTDEEAERVEALYARWFNQPGLEASGHMVPDADTGDMP